VFEKIDITPKVGVWDLKNVFKLDLGPENEASNIVVPVNVRNAVALGVEGGLQFSSDRFVSRLWGSYDVSVTPASNNSGGSVRGKRYGVDTLFRVYELGQKHSGRWVTPMLFALQENLVITSSKGQTYRSGNSDISLDGVNIGLTMTYLGAGIGVVF
jgi:hypothetical protein